MRFIFSRISYPFFFLILMYWSIAPPVYSANRVGIRVGNTHYSRTMQSVLELRWKKLTRQGWDKSCGAAALSTLLTYHQQKQFSEIAITLTILKNSNPELVKKRGGFSLYDLKRFVTAIGLEGLGYGKMTLDDLDQFNIPAILPVRIGDFDHFVVFKRRIANHILFGDPAFGNISLPVDRFEKIWKSRIAFYVVTISEKETMAKNEKAQITSPLSPKAMDTAIPDLGYASRLCQRIPLIPLTRRMIRVSP